MLVIKGAGAKLGEIPAAQEAALRYFEDVSAFLHKIEDVDTVRPLSAPGAYLVTHRPVGALGYQVTLAYVIHVTPTPDGLRWEPRDFDHTKVKSPHDVLKGYSEGSLVARPKTPVTTHLDFRFTIAVDLPLPGALKLVPRPLIQSTADAIMGLKVGATVESLYQKVVEDFRSGH